MSKCEHGVPYAYGCPDCDDEAWGLRELARRLWPEDWDCTWYQAMSQLPRGYVKCRNLMPLRTNACEGVIDAR